MGLPGGTVTFLFTDIEGSTRLLTRLGDRYPDLLGEHGAILREAVTAAGGVEVSTEGDSFFCVFTSAPKEVEAAVAAQRGLARHPWPEGVEVKVRMGLHTGEGIHGGDNYVGLDVHRASRVAEAGHGGQVLLSAATRALVEGSLPPGVGLRELGQHRLKDLTRPEELSQLVIEGLPDEFPALRTLEAVRHNLPVQLTSFVGRPQVNEVVRLLADHRLVTLTGPGGTGKTRLSLQVAAESVDRFPDGVFFVPLAAITDPELVPSAVAEVLGVESTGSLADAVTEHLRSATTLLVLDNLEQVLGAAAFVSRLLHSAPGVKVLATSRAPLHLAGEQEYPVPGLGLPIPGELRQPEDLERWEATRLFLERAQEAYLEALGAAETAGDQFTRGWVLRMLAALHLELPDPDGARRYLAQALPVFLDAGDVSAVALHLRDFAVLALREGDDHRALRLMGAVAAVEQVTGSGLTSVALNAVPEMAEVIQRVGEEQAEQVMDEGRRLTIDQAVDLALQG